MTFIQKITAWACIIIAALILIACLVLVVTTIFGCLFVGTMAVMAHPKVMIEVVIMAGPLLGIFIFFKYILPWACRILRGEEP